VKRDPRVTLMVEDGEEYGELRGVVIEGNCELVDDLEAVKQTLIDVTTRGAAPDAAGRAAMGNAVAGTAAKRVLLRIKPRSVVSWDHRKLGGKY
jgi:hypothetical protein